jgi:hypothetical protein
VIIGRHAFWGQSAMALLANGIEVPIPTCPTPAYISGFQEIQIKYFHPYKKGEYGGTQWECGIE